MINTGITGAKYVNGKTVVVDRDKYRRYMSRKQMECESKEHIKPKRKLYYSQWRKETSSKYHKLIFDMFDNKCVRCGFSDERALQIDHINNDGYKDAKKNGKGASWWYLKNVYKSLLKGEKKYQVLCANCNWIKRTENESKLASKEV